MGVIRQIGNHVNTWKLLVKRRALGLGPLPINKFEEIEADPNTIDADQINNMLEMIDIVIERGLLFSRTNQDGVDSDDTASRADPLDLFVRNIALDVIV